MSCISTVHRLLMHMPKEWIEEISFQIHILSMNSLTRYQILIFVKKGLIFFSHLPFPDFLFSSLFLIFLSPHLFLFNSIATFGSLRPIGYPYGYCVNVNKSWMVCYCFYHNLQHWSFCNIMVEPEMAVLLCHYLILSIYRLVYDLSAFLSWFQRFLWCFTMVWSCF